MPVNIIEFTDKKKFNGEFAEIEVLEYKVLDRVAAVQIPAGKSYVVNTSYDNRLNSDDPIDEAVIVIDDSSYPQYHIVMLGDGSTFQSRFPPQNSERSVEIRLRSLPAGPGQDKPLVAGSHQDPDGATFIFSKTSYYGGGHRPGHGPGPIITAVRDVRVTIVIY